jgi:hypothetical protein
MKAKKVTYLIPFRSMLKYPDSFNEIYGLLYECSKTKRAIYLQSGTDRWRHTNAAYAMSTPMCIIRNHAQRMWYLKVPDGYHVVTDGRAVAASERQVKPVSTRYVVCSEIIKKYVNTP